MPKPHQTYLYLNRQSRTRHNATSNRSQYNIDRVTAGEAKLTPEEVFCKQLDDLQESDLNELLRQTSQLDNLQSSGAALPAELFLSWARSEALQQILRLSAHTLQNPSLETGENDITDDNKRTIVYGRIRVIFGKADGVEKFEKFLKKTSKEVPVPHSQTNSLSPSSISGLFRLDALTLLVAILLSLVIEKKSKGR